jgi:hypothetical protein
MVSSVVYFNLLKKEQDFFALNSVRDCYDCSVVNITMNNWLKDNS